MKSVQVIRTTMVRQWQRPDKREALLLGGSDVWPLSIPIGRPAPRKVEKDIHTVRLHVQEWRNVRLGNVLLEPIQYRAASKPVEIPVCWEFSDVAEWVKACNNREILKEFKDIAKILEAANVMFQSMLVRRRSLWASVPLTDTLLSLDIVMRLRPGMADGKPLRMLAIEGVDTKFFERNERLLTALLDIRFDGEAGRSGLRRFLGAAPDDEHWLLVADLDGGLLPYHTIRVTTRELMESGIPCDNLLIIENERCLHQLPEGILRTAAVLGSGLDVGWTRAEWMAEKRVYYWGDIDTWGLCCLAGVRRNASHTQALMMTMEVLDRFLERAVNEPSPAENTPPDGLTPRESELYMRLRKEKQGRLEQEFLPVEFVQQFIRDKVQDAG